MNKWLGLILALSLSACGGSGSSDSIGTSAQGDSDSSGNARIGLIFTDATTLDYTRALVTFTKVELVGENQRVTLFSGEQALDLLRLPDFYEFVDTADVPPGNYKSVWITATDVSLVSQDSEGNETITEAKLPSGTIKVLSKSGFSIDAGDVLFLEVDFDMHKALKLTETGSGKVILRPVIFANIYSQIPRNKFIRVHGTVGNLSGQSFDLCQTHMITDLDGSVPEGEGRCFKVAADAEVGVFADTGLPIPIEQLEDGNSATVIGRLTRQMRYVPEVPDEVLPDTGFCRIWYLDLEPDEQPEALPCSEVGILPEDTVLVDSNGVTSEHLFEILAYTIEKGSINAFSRFNGDVESDVDDLLGRFDFGLASGQGLDASVPLPVQLFEKSRIFDADGEALDHDAIQSDIPALVDAVFVPSDIEPDILRSPFVLLTSTSPALETLNGVVVALDVGANIMEVQLESLANVLVETDSVKIYLITSTDDDFTSEEIEVGDIPLGSTVEIFGVEDSSSGNFIAETIFVHAD